MVIRALNSSSSLAGETQVTLNGGKARFTDIVMIAEPGTIATFEVVSSAIDTTRVAEAQSLT